MFELNDSVMSSIFNLAHSLGGSDYAFQLMTKFVVCDSVVNYYQDSSDGRQAVVDVFCILSNVRVNDNFFTLEEVGQKLAENIRH